MPHEDLIYVADQIHIPYGSKTAAEIQSYSAAITDFFRQQGAKIIVVACNTATAAAINFLRQSYPDLPFVGMEPAIKPAAASSRSGVVAVMATHTTIDSPRYASLMERFAQNIRVIENPCRGLVEQIEAGAISTAETRVLLESILEPMMAEQADTLILGCTHYPFVQPLIADITNDTVEIINPAIAVARQTERVLGRRQLLKSGTTAGSIKAYTSGSPAGLTAAFSHLLQLDVQARPLPSS